MKVLSAADLKSSFLVTMELHRCEDDATAEAQMTRGTGRRGLGEGGGGGGGSVTQSKIFDCQFLS